VSVVDTSMFADSVGLEPFPVSPGVGSGLKQWAGRTVEKLRAAVAGGLRFLPRLDNYTEETPEIRAGYRLMLREPVLKSSHKTKVEAVAQLDWRVIPVDKRSPRDLDVAAFVELAVERVRGGKSHMARSALRGSILDGFGVAEKVWEQHTRGRFAGKWRWKALKGKDTQHLTLSTDQFRNVTAVRPVAYGIGQSYDPDDFVIFSHDALFESALGTSDHRAAYGPFWFKDTIKKLWALHLDKYVSPVLLGSYSDYPQKVALEEALEQARSDTWLTIPQGATVAALQLATRGEAEFEAACDYQDRQMLIATSGAYLQVLEGKISDGRGDTSIHRDAAALFQWALAEGWQALINEQLVPELVEANFAGADPPQVALGSISDLELKPALDVDKGLQEMGFRHSREKLAEYYGREEATDPSDVLTPAGGGGDAQGSQGMRERFRRFAEWERFCNEGENKGKPGPCPTGRKKAPAGKGRPKAKGDGGGGPGGGGGGASAGAVKSTASFDAPTAGKVADAFEFSASRAPEGPGDIGGQGLAALPELHYRLEKATGQKVPPAEFRGLVDHLHRSGAVNLHVLNEVKNLKPAEEPLVISRGDRAAALVSIKDPGRLRAELEKYGRGELSLPATSPVDTGRAPKTPAGATPAPPAPKPSPAPAPKPAAPPAPAPAPAPTPPPKAAPKPKAARAPKAPKPANVAVKAAADRVAKINRQVDAAKAKLDTLKGHLKAAKADLAAVKGGAKAAATGRGAAPDPAAVSADAGRLSTLAAGKVSDADATAALAPLAKQPLAHVVAVAKAAGVVSPGRSKKSALAALASTLTANRRAEESIQV
jgi:outer membrane biosynthesis protein TonB